MEQAKCPRCETSEKYKDGRCKKCTQMWNKKWADRNKDKIREIGVKWYKENKEKHLKRGKKWRENNLDKCREYTKRYRERHPERERLNCKRWRQNNPTKMSVLNHNYRTQKNGNGGSYTESEWENLCKKYDYKCLRCGKKKKLTVDHILPVSKGGTSNINNLQPLCKSCNSKKFDKHIDYRYEIGK